MEKNNLLSLINQYAVEMKNGDTSHENEFGRFIVEQSNQFVRMKKSQLVQGDLVDYEMLPTEMWCKIDKVLNGYDEKSSFKSYFLACCSNTLIDMIRKEKHNLENSYNSYMKNEDGEEVQVIDTVSSSEDIEMGYITKCRNEKLREALNEISPEYSKALVGKYMDGMKTKEIASDMGISESNANNYVARGKKELKKKLEEKDF